MKRKKLKTREQRIEEATSYCSKLLISEAKKLGYDCIDGGTETANSTTFDGWVIFDGLEDIKLTQKTATGLILDVKHNALNTDEKWKIQSGELYTYNEMGDKLKIIKKWK